VRYLYQYFWLKITGNQSNIPLIFANPLERYSLCLGRFTFEFLPQGISNNLAVIIPIFLLPLHLHYLLLNLHVLLCLHPKTILNALQHALLQFDFPISHPHLYSLPVFLILNHYSWFIALSIILLLFLNLLLYHYSIRFSQQITNLPTDSHYCCCCCCCHYCYSDC